MNSNLLDRYEDDPKHIVSDEWTLIQPSDKAIVTQEFLYAFWKHNPHLRDRYHCGDIVEIRDMSVFPLRGEITGSIRHPVSGCVSFYSTDIIIGMRKAYLDKERKK